MHNPHEIKLYSLRAKPNSLDPLCSFRRYIERTIHFFLKQSKWANIILSKLIFFHTLVSLHCALFYPFISYDSTDHSGISLQTRIKKRFLTPKWKKFLHLMTFSHYIAHSNMLFKSLKYLFLHDAVNHPIWKLMKLFSNGNLGKQLNNSLPINVSGNQSKTRSEEQLYIPKISTVKFVTGSLRDNALLIWNKFSKTNKN